MNVAQNHHAYPVPLVPGASGFSKSAPTSHGRAYAGRKCAPVNSSGHLGLSVFASGYAKQSAQVSGLPDLSCHVIGYVDMSAGLSARHASVASLPNTAVKALPSVAWTRRMRRAPYLSR